MMSIMNFNIGNVPRDRLVPNPQGKLLARYRQLSLRTEEAYWDWTRRYLVFWKDKAGIPRIWAPPR